MASAHPGGERVEQLANTHDPTNSWRRTDVGLTLAYRLLRWPNIKTTLVQRLCLLVIPSQNKTTLILQTADPLSFSKLQIHCHSPNCRSAVILQTADPLSFSKLQIHCHSPNCRFTVILQTADPLSFSKLQIRCHSPNCRFTVILQTADSLSFSKLQIHCHSPNCRSAFILQTADPLSFSKLQIRCHSPNCKFTVILFATSESINTCKCKINSALVFCLVSDLEGGGWGFSTLVFIYRAYELSFTWWG